MQESGRTSGYDPYQTHSEWQGQPQNTWQQQVGWQSSPPRHRPQGPPTSDRMTRSTTSGRTRPNFRGTARGRGRPFSRGNRMSTTTRLTPLVTRQPQQQEPLQRENPLAFPLIPLTTSNPVTIIPTVEAQQILPEQPQNEPSFQTFEDQYLWQEKQEFAAIQNSYRQFPPPPPHTRLPPFEFTDPTTVPWQQNNTGSNSLKYIPQTKLSQQERSDQFLAITYTPSPFAAAQTFPDPPPSIGVPLNTDIRANSEWTTAPPPYGGPLFPSGPKETILDQLQSNPTAPIPESNHIAHRCHLCSELRLPVEYGLKWTVTTGICDGEFGCCTIQLTCLTPSAAPKLPLGLDLDILRPRPCVNVLSPTWVLLFDFAGIIIPILIPYQKQNFTLVSKNAANKITYKLERRLQDYNIYASIYDFAILCLVPPGKYAYLPRSSSIYHNTLLAGYQHFDKYVLHARVIGLRMWNCREIQWFTNHELLGALNELKRAPNQVPEQPRMPIQPTMPPLIANWLLPVVGPDVQKIFTRRNIKYTFYELASIPEESSPTVQNIKVT
jgi:hypothetical protein